MHGFILKIVRILLLVASIGSLELYPQQQPFKPVVLPPPPKRLADVNRLVQKNPVASQYAVMPVRPGLTPQSPPTVVPASTSTFSPPPIAAPLLVNRQESPIATRIKELSLRTTFLEKISGLQELAALVTLKTSAADKNSIFLFCKEIIANQALMKKDEIEMLHARCSDMVKTTGLLDPLQHNVVNQWIQSLALARELIGTHPTLLVALKAVAIDDKKNYNGALKAARYAMLLFDTMLPAAELNKQQPGSLVTVLRTKIPHYFNNRAHKTKDELVMLQEIVKIAENNKNVADVVNKRWQATLQLDIALRTADEYADVLQKIAAWKNIATLITPAIGHYEKKCFIDALTTFFINRNERAARELTEFKAVLDIILSSQAKSPQTYSPAKLITFDRWRKIIEATQILLAIRPDSSLEQKISILTPLLPTIALLEATVEKNLLIKLMSSLFEERGNFQKVGLIALNTFFQASRKTPTLFAANQNEVLDIWISELNRAQAITQNAETYLASLIKQSVATKNIDQVVLAVGLFTTATASDIRNTLVHGLNELFKMRDRLDKVKLKELLLVVDKQKIEGTSLLTEAQRAVLLAWLKLIK